MQNQKNSQVAKSKKNKVKARYNAMLTTGPTGASQRLALQHSRYLNSILDPLAFPGAKIPDEVTAPSFTAQVITKFSGNAAANGGSALVGLGWGKIVGAVGSTLGNFFQLQPVAASSTSYTSVAGAGAWAGGTSVSNVANLVRPVSAGVWCQVQGSANNNQGRIILVYAPPNDALSAFGTAGTNITLTSILAGAYVTEVPATKCIGRAIWLPIDDMARSYCPTGVTTLTPARGNALLYQYGVLFALFDGAVAGTAAEFTFVENYEIIPQNSSANILSPTASHSDPLELAASANFLSANPRISVMQPSALSVTGCPDSGMRKVDSSGPSFLDSVLSGVEKAGKVMTKVAPIAAEMLAML